MDITGDLCDISPTRAKGLTGCVNHQAVQWDTGKDKCFQKLKTSVAEQVVLVRPDYDSEFIVDS